MKFKRNVPNKNLTVIFSVLIIFVTSLLTYIFTNVEFELVPNNYIQIAVFILGVVNTVFGCFPLIYFFQFGGQKWMIKQFMVVLFNSFFSNRIEFFKSNYPNDIEKITYRITYFTFYERRSFVLRVIALYRKIRKNKFEPQRQIDINNSYLLCKYRYGLEDGRFTHEKTTKPYVLYDDDENLRGVTSLIFKYERKVYFCIDNFNINSIIKKVKENGTGLSFYEKDLSQKSIEENIKRMELLISAYNKLNSGKLVTDDEKEELITFMKKTHTDFNDMFNINEGTHANHFLGFKVYNQQHDPIGLFIIDAREPSQSSSFEEIVFNKQKSSSSVGNKSNTEVINNILEIFSRLTSKSVIDMSLDLEDDNSGKRIRD